MRIVRHTLRMWILLGWCVSAVGCGGGGSTAEMEVGCRINDDVSPELRQELETVVATFFQRAREGAFDIIHAEAASAIRDVQSARNFTGPIAHAVKNVGVPPNLQTEQVITLRFSPEFPYQDAVECRMSDDSPSLVLSIAEYPEQALVVQIGQAAGEFIYYSTLWYREEGSWRLAGFFLKPASLLGRRWEAYDAWADAQLAAGNKRNAALLYNAAIELVIPNGWTQPPELPGLERKQGRISVTHLPVNRVDPWVSEPDTFRVFHSAYVSLPELAVLFRYLTPAPLADTTAQAAYADRLYKYITTNFTEYNEIFSSVILQSMESPKSDNPWTKIYPLVKER